MPLDARFHDLAGKVSNWGRWGTEDQRGTLNFITPDAVLRGASAIRQGRAFSLAIPFDENGPQTGAIAGRHNPERRMLAVNQRYAADASGFTTSDDTVSMATQAATHWDALAHAGYGDRLYNGNPASVVDERGARRLGIENFGPVAGRGVLLDVARALEVEYFEDGHPITGLDLDRAVELAGVEVKEGDILCVRTGQMRWLQHGHRDLDRFAQPSPGLSTQSVAWLHEQRVAAVATDTLVFECWPCENPAVLLPVHLLHLRDMGLAQGQLWALDELAADCVSDGQYDFFLVATPLPLTHGLGAPVAPTAIK